MNFRTVLKLATFTRKKEGKGRAFGASMIKMYFGNFFRKMIVHQLKICVSMTPNILLVISILLIIIQNEYFTTCRSIEMEISNYRIPIWRSWRTSFWCLYDERYIPCQNSGLNRGVNYTIFKFVLENYTISKVVHEKYALSKFFPEKYTIPKVVRVSYAGFKKCY